MLRKKTLPLLLLQFFIIISNGFANNHIVMSNTLQKLLDDWALYKLDSQGDPYLHEGDLLEHALWVYFSAIELLQTDNPYSANLRINIREKEVVALACLLHDIGKAGRKELFDKTHNNLYYSVYKDNNNIISHIDYLQDRQEHPCICFEYLAAPFLNKHSHDECTHAYCFADSTLLNIKALYHELGIDEEEQKIIAILAGIHYDFGNLKHGKITPQQFLDKLQSLTNKVNYNNGYLNETIIRLSIFIQVADVMGLHYKPSQKTKLFPEAITTKIRHSSYLKDPYIQLGYAPENPSETPAALIVMEDLLAYFRNEYQHPHQINNGPYAARAFA